MTNQFEAPKSARHRAFCDRVIAGERLTDAWIGSAADVNKPEPSNASAAVNGSRCAARYADHIAQQKAEHAQARAADAQPVTRESIHTLMESVTEQLIQAATAADTAGAQSTATACRRLITIHAGRAQRANTRAPVKESATDEFDPQEAAERLKWCDCD